MPSKLLLNDHYSPRISADLQTICEPLKKFGITYFASARVFNDLTSYFLSTHWDSTNHHLKKEHPVGRFIPVSEEGKKFHHLPFLSKETSPAEQQAFNDYRDLFNVSHPIYFIERHKHCIDIFCYATEAHNIEIINFYITNIDILEKFKFYFKEKASPIIKNVMKNKLHLSQKMCPSLELNVKANSESEKNKTLKEISPEKFIFSFKGYEVVLTKQECAVLKNLLKGCTIKEASKNLELSPRTVENYFNNVKQKMGEHHKSDIIKIIYDLNLL